MVDSSEKRLSAVRIEARFTTCANAKTIKGDVEDEDISSESERLVYMLPSLHALEAERLVS